MLVSAENLWGTPIMSLQTGAQIAETRAAIIDPRHLSIAAFYVEGPNIAEPTVLHPSDIRELSDIGIIVDSQDKLMSLDGLVRLQQVIDFGFDLKGLKVVDEHKRKLGKVSEYSVETDGFTIQQVYTEQSLLRSFSTMGSTIHRSQIVSVTNDVLVVSSPTVREEVHRAAKTATQTFANPFRNGDTQPEN